LSKKEVKERETCLSFKRSSLSPSPFLLPSSSPLNHSPRPRAPPNGSSPPLSLSAQGRTAASDAASFSLSSSNRVLEALCLRVFFFVVEDHRSSIDVVDKALLPRLPPCRPLRLPAILLRRLQGNRSDVRRDLQPLARGTREHEREGGWRKNEFCFNLIDRRGGIRFQIQPPSSNLNHLQLSHLSSLSNTPPSPHPRRTRPSRPSTASRPSTSSRASARSSPRPGSRSTSSSRPPRRSPSPRTARASGPRWWSPWSASLTAWAARGAA